MKRKGSLLNFFKPASKKKKPNVKYEKRLQFEVQIKLNIFAVPKRLNEVARPVSIQLKRDAENKFDPEHAICALFKGKRFGYLSRGVCRKLANLLEASVISLECFLNDAISSSDRSSPIHVKIYQAKPLPGKLSKQWQALSKWCAKNKPRTTAKLKQQVLFSPLTVGAPPATPESSKLLRSFPDVVLNIIFSHITNQRDLYVSISLTCKRWGEAVSRLMPHRAKRWKREACTYDCLKSLQIALSTPSSVPGLPNLGVRSLINEAILDSLTPRQRKLLPKVLKWIFQTKEIPTTGLYALMGSCLLIKDAETAFFMKSVFRCLKGKNVPMDLVSDLFHLVAHSYTSDQSLRFRMAIDGAIFHNSYSFPVREGDIKLTAEQHQIICTEMKHQEIMRINAFAGTGKTTCLRAYGRSRPWLKMLYICYNAAISQDASSNFPDNVECRNIHKVAYRYIGWKYQKKLKSGYKWVSGFGGVVSQRFVKLTVEKFCRSPDAEISMDHVSSQAFDWILGEKNMTEKKFVQMCRKFWEKMKDSNDMDVNMTHDGYLKLYQLSQPKWEVDLILLDEAQDCNAVLWDIISKQKCPKIVVGDVHQQIYSFLDTIDILTKVRVTYNLYLTHSFRFGGNIGALANTAIVGLKNETKFIQTKKRDKVYFPLQGLTYPRSYTYIFRNNHTLISQAIDFVSRGKRVAFVGGIQKYDLTRILDVFYLANAERNKIKSNFIKRFETYRELLLFVEKTADANLRTILRLIQSHENLDKKIAKLQKSVVNDERLADVVFTTVHKAKGLEWENVRLAEDVFNVDNSVLDNQNLSDEIINIAYVAITRAKNSLYASEGVADVFKFMLSHLYKHMKPIEAEIGIKCKRCSYHFSNEKTEGQWTEWSLAVNKKEHYCPKCSRNIDGIHFKKKKKI